jgi:hypothetical protein
LQAKALAEKNERDLQVQWEQEERHVSLYDFSHTVRTQCDWAIFEFQLISRSQNLNFRT